MLILVAGRASLGNAQERPGQVLDLDDSSGRRRDVLSRVAFTAFHTLVLAFKNVARQLVVEGLGVPLYDRKVFAVVFGVALATRIVATFGNVVGGVKTLACSETSSNFRVAALTLQGRCRAELVAVEAMQRTA